MKWVEDVENALKSLGGESRLSQIYEIVKQKREEREDTLGEYEAWVRNALQGNSRGRGRDIFVHVSRGVWKLK